jgi:hypothetical protein
MVLLLSNAFRPPVRYSRSGRPSSRHGCARRSAGARAGPASQPVRAPLEKFLTDTGATAVLVLRDAQLLYERSFNGHGPSSTQTSLSVAKSFDSVLVGVVLADGDIGSVEDRMTEYLGRRGGPARWRRPSASLLARVRRSSPGR